MYEEGRTVKEIAKAIDKSLSEVNNMLAKTDDTQTVRGTPLCQGESFWVRIEYDYWCGCGKSGGGSLFVVGVFRVPENSARMLQKDLRKTREDWIKKAVENPDEHRRRVENN